ncbi:response regulator [Duganella sp. FT135W]|uniref:Response regulator n=1 Tax=Duganella flavida TaxID=2692175 RepID=A0A6L8K864_9BURK|nr:response regulator [Duganella flavida]MYM23225.1 response regulator [Duganella flavida]
MQNEPTPTGLTGQRPIRVLIVDDNIDAGEILCELLSALGYITLFHESAAAALSCLEVFQPDVCLSDICMPEMDGYKFAIALRAHPQYAHLKLVALTAYALPKDRAAALDAGFNDHLSKTAGIEKILQVLGPSGAAVN